MTKRNTKLRAGSRRRAADEEIRTLPERLADARRALVAFGGGAAMVVLGAGLATSFATHSISDPTWNQATPAPVSNAMGALGANLSDAFLQAFGGAAWLIVANLLLWGLVAVAGGPGRLPARTPLVAWARIALAPVALALAALALSIAPTPQTWPFVVGVGGALGDGLNALATSAIGPGRFATAGVLVAGIVAAIVQGFVLGLTIDRLEDGAHSFAALVRRGRRRLARIDVHLPHVDRLGRGAPGLAGLMRSGAEAEKDDVRRSGRRRPEPPVDEEAFDDELAAAGDDDVDGGAGGALDEVAAEAARQRNIIRTEPSKAKAKNDREAREAQPRFPMFSPGDYQLPTLNLFAKPPATKAETVSDEALEKNARMLESVLADFGVRGEIINVRPGPVVTLYELEPAAGVKSSRVIGLADDIARSMSAIAARVAVIPGRNAIGIELPNQRRETVFIREMLGAPDYESTRGDLTLALGKSIGGEPVFADLARMPHLLIAGTTGSGKSVGINVMILSLLYRLPPDRCKLIMIDPKMLELSVYEGIPHLLSPVVTDPKKAVVALKWTVREMEERYRKMSKVGVRNITGFNQRIAEAEEAGETLSRKVHTGYDQETGDPIYETEELDYEEMPFIVVIIDEVADLMMVAGKDIEGMVQRLAQMARAAGIHLIMATQRPSVDVITGTIKANFPTRISFQVTSKIDSRTILGEQGAEQLLGQGDMLHMAGGGRITRVHGAFVSDDEVEKVVKHLKKQGKPDYVQEVTELNDEDDGAFAGLDIGGNTSSGDALYDKAVAVVLRDRKASTSYIQRRLQIGYNRAATLIERMEDEGVVSPANHAGKRDILAGEDAA
ncbi:MAG: cell division protein FtsK [Alphaproteobacteria bacterium]|nr:cell division protein FtsK [Alphaproteobacteria bacterium]